mgnify:CR=1 FL=1
MRRIAFLLCVVTQPINFTTFSGGLSPSSFPNPISFIIDLRPSSPEVAVTITQVIMTMIRMMAMVAIMTEY